MVNVAQHLRRFVFCPVLACFLGVLLFAGCGKPPETHKSQTTSQAMTTTNSAPPPSPEVAGPGPNEKVCFACKGEGTVACRVPGCVDGKVDCPAPCIKLNKGIWVKRPDRAPGELMQAIEVNGNKWWVSSHHPGVTYTESPGGGGLDMHTCPVCKGTTKVTCPICKGTGKVTCPICNGKKFIPIACTPTNNPYFNSQPDVIRLADGQVLLGRVAAEVGDDRTIVTRDKKILHVKASDILPKTETNSPATQTSPSI
jgi:hypothetical protein